MQSVEEILGKLETADNTTKNRIENILVDKGKAEIRFARLAFLIFLFGDAGAFCHFILRKARDFPHGADAFRDLC